MSLPKINECDLIFIEGGTWGFIHQFVLLKPILDNIFFGLPFSSDWAFRLRFGIQ